MLKPVIVMTCAIASAVTAGLGLIRLDDRATPAVEAAAVTSSSSETATTEDAHATAIPKAQDGHFWANATVNSHAVHFLVDTGATVVVLTEADAQRLGFDMSSLTYNHKVITAMGATQAAQVTLSSVAVGDSTVHDVDALVLPEGGTSLLGMSYLGRLSRIEATQSSLILHP